MACMPAKFEAKPTVITSTAEPPKGAERYTLAYWLLSRRPMTEKKLVRVILTLYAVAGAQPDQARLILAVLYAVLLPPFALIARLGGDSLQRRATTPRWHERAQPPRGLEQGRRQFS